MRKERYGIYCFSDEKTLFAPLRYTEESGQTIGKLVYLGAWVQMVITINKGTMPKTLPDVPPDFMPRVFAYTTFKEINPDKLLDRCADNVFVVLMPGFVPADLAALHLSLEARYQDHMRTNNIDAISSDESEDILEIKPNFAGFGVNVNALWKRWFRRS